MSLIGIQNNDSLSVITVQEIQHHICSAGLITCWCVHGMKLKRSPILPGAEPACRSQSGSKREEICSLQGILMVQDLFFSSLFGVWECWNREWRHAGCCVVHPVHVLHSRNTWRLWHGDDGTENSVIVGDLSGCLQEYAAMCKRTVAEHQRFCPDNDPFRLQPHRLKWNCLTKSIDYQRHAALL